MIGENEYGNDEIIKIQDCKNKFIKYRIQGTLNDKSTILEQFKIPQKSFWKNFWRRANFSKKKLELLFLITWNRVSTKNKLKHYINIDELCQCGEIENLHHLLINCNIGK